MIFLLICVIIGLILIGISFIYANNQKKEFSNVFYKAQVLNVNEENGNYETYLKIYDHPNMDECILTINIKLPVGTKIEVTILNDNATIYFKQVNQNEIFKVLSLTEKWRYSGLSVILIGVFGFIISENGYVPSLLGLLLSILAIASLVIVKKTQYILNKYNSDISTESLVNVKGIPIAQLPKGHLVAYNYQDVTNVVIFHKKNIKTDSVDFVYCPSEDTVAVINKKQLTITNIVALIASIGFVITSLIILLI